MVRKNEEFVKTVKNGFFFLRNMDKIVYILGVSNLIDVTY